MKENQLEKVQKLLNSTPQELRLQVLKSILSGIDDQESKKLFETAFLMAMEISAPPPNPQVVVLIHGIRTHAIWQERLAEHLNRKSDIKVIPIGYGYLDVLKFLCPFLTRTGPIRRVLRELRTIRSQYPLADISVVAHSFGTYILSEIIAEETDVKLHRIQLCGSIIKGEYRWDKVMSRISGAVVNDAGTEDKWPVFAKISSWGYGPSGTFGFKTASVTDRYYDCGHSDFFDDEHMRNYWLPLLLDGRVVPSPWSARRSAPGSIVTFLNILPLKLIITILIVFLIGMKYY